MGSSYISPCAIRWLQTTQRATLLHHFDQVCNLVNEEGEVLSLVTPIIGMGPFFWMIDEDRFKQIDSRRPITVDTQRLSVAIGSLTFSAKDIPQWMPKPDWAMLRQRLLTDVDHANLFDNLSQNNTAAYVVPKEIEEWTEQLLQGIAHHHLPQVAAGAYQLAGRGVGLTPTGDDLLVGILYALWTWRSEDGRLPQFVEKIVQTLIKTASPRTTTLSAAFIRAAGAGEATVHWHDLADGRPNAIEQICAIGHTSGRDAWMGFVQASQILK